MKKQYLQSLPKATDIKNEAYNAYLANVQQIFGRIQKNYDLQQSQYLLEEIKKLKDVRQMKKPHKKPIYEFFLKRQLKTFSYIKGDNTIDFDIIKLTKTKIDGFKLDWKEIWQRILKEVPQSGSACSKWIQNFIKHIKIYFDQNNLLEVWEYFQNVNFKDISKMVHLFVRITPNTKQQLLNQFVQTLINNCKVQRITNSQFLVLFLWLQKNRKRLTLSKQVFQFVNDLVLEFILANNQKSSKKGTVQNNFNAGSAELLEKTLGKENPGSLDLLKIIFSFIKKFIKPLQNSSKSVMFVYWLFKSIFQRVQAQKKIKQKLVKLEQKIAKKKQEQEQEVQQKLQITQQQKKQNLKKQQLQDNDEQDQEQQEEQQEQQDEQLQQLIMLGQTSKINFEKDDQINQKEDNDDEQKQKLEKLLANELTKEILDYLQKQIEEIFEIIYFVNSKKTISYLLRYIFRLFPKFVLKSLDALDKAANIPNISQDGLVRNLTVTVQHMFVQDNYKDGIKNIMRVIEKANNSRRIVDVWYIYESLISKIPLLDEKDLQAVPDQDKELFQKKFQLNHDRFYEQYSDHMVQAFTRLIKQGQYLEKGQYKSYSTTMQQTFHNSYPFMKKRILSAVMQVISQKPNALALFYLAFSELPQKQFEIFKNNFLSINQQNKDTEQLRLQMLGVLSRGMTLQQLKPYIRKMAEKGHFRLIQDYAVYRCLESIKWQPYKTTLNYFYQDPKIKIQFENSLQRRKSCLKQLQKYRNELLDEAMKLMDEIKQDQPDTVPQRVIKSYTTTTKIQTFSQRKKIYEILSIVANINFMMEQKLIQIKNSKKLQLVNSDVSPYGFLNVNNPFSKYIKKILRSQQVLHDPKLISIINKILTDEFFMYLDIEINEDKKLSKQKKRNKNHEAPEYVNRVTFGNQYIALSRSYMALLLHKTNGGIMHDIKGKTEELFILSLVHSNQAYKDLRSMFQESKMIPVYRQYLIETMKFKVQNRQLIKRISSTIDFLTKKENILHTFSDEQVLNFVSYHASLMQSNDSKVKENAIKSFRKFANIIYEHPISDNLTQSMLKYRHTQKLQMIWIIYIAALIHHSKFTEQKQLAQKRIFYLLKHTQQLILHDSRSIRRASLYLYPSLIRMLKKLNNKSQQIKFEPQQYKKKQLSQMIQTGFLRPQFYNKDLKDKSIHRRHPQKTYKVKQSYEVPSYLFDFLLQHPDKSEKFLKTFHSDLASSAEMMISAMQSALTTVDLFGIANKAIQKLIYFYKTSDMTLSRSQILVGAKFFKYLCLEDSKRGYKFFAVVKQFVLSCLSNMESLDNHNLVILYAYSLTNAYETNFKQRIPEIQIFLAKIFKEVIKKSSKSIYTKLQTLFFKKVKNSQAIKFIEEMCEEMIQKNNKIFRTGYLLATIDGKSYSTSEKLLRKMFNERLELEHESNINSTLTFLLSFPQFERWYKKDILSTNVIDLEKLKEQNKVEEVLGAFIMFSNKDLQNYLVKTIKQLLEGQSIEMSKTSFTILNNLIKCCTQLYMSNQYIDFVVDLLNVWTKMLKERRQLQLDYESGNKAISYLLGSNVLPRQIFQKFLNVILDNVEPNKKSCDLLIEILNSPINYLKISNPLFQKFIRKILDFENNSQIYKQLLQILSTLFRYRIEPFQKLNQLQKDNKSKRALLLQAYLLAQNAQLKPQIVKQVLKISLKDRKNIWAREMKLIRGQRQFFDKQQTYQIWKEVKQLSNTYNYHA